MSRTGAALISAAVLTAMTAAPPASADEASVDVRFEGEPGFKVQDRGTMKELCVTPCASPVRPGAELALVPAKATSDAGMEGYLRVAFEAANGRAQVARLSHPRDPWFTGFGIGLGVLGTAGVITAIAAPSGETNDPSKISPAVVKVGLGVLSGLVLLGGVVILASGPRYYRVDVVKPDGSVVPTRAARAFSPFTF